MVRMTITVATSYNIVTFAPPLSVTDEDMEVIAHELK